MNNFSSNPRKYDETTILITGGAGFIGSNFASHVFQRYPAYRILVLDSLTYAGNPDNLSRRIRESDRFEFWYGSVTQPSIVESLVARSDYIVHFAAETHVARSIYDNSKFFETDVLGTQTLMNAALKFPTVKKVIHISSSEVYGTSLTKKMNEEHPLNPLSPYAAAKCGADRLVYSYMHTYSQLPAVIVRPFNTYGPYQHLEKVIPRFITSALLDESLTIHGDGQSMRDWIHVHDLCEGLDRIMHCQNQQINHAIINLGTGRSLSVLEIARQILTILDKTQSLLRFIGDRPGQVQNHCADIRSAQRLLGFKARISFEEGLQKTIDWYKSHSRWWKKLIWMRMVPVCAKNGKIEMH